MEDHCHIQTDYHTNGDSRRSQVSKAVAEMLSALSPTGIATISRIQMEVIPALMT